MYPTAPRCIIWDLMLMLSRIWKSCILQSCTIHFFTVRPGKKIIIKYYNYIFHMFVLSSGLPVFVTKILPLVIFCSAAYLLSIFQSLCGRGTEFFKSVIRKS